jgi:hypothetical protein
MLDRLQLLLYLDLQLHMQSVPITTNVVISNPAQAGAFDSTLCDDVGQ